jgi:hypothetical protein
MRHLVLALTFIATLIPAVSLAQGWNIDARTVGMSGIGGAQNIFATTVAESRGDRSFVIPLGLFQTLRNIDTFKARSTSFDPSRAVEFASNPFHLQFGRTRTGTAAEFVHGIRNATLSRDLNDYRGFVPRSFATSGLIAPKWGYTFELSGTNDGARHSVYAGGGPHLTLRTRVDTDPALTAVLDADTPTYLGNELLHLDTRSSGQLAAAITGGYRGRFPFAQASSAFLSVNANYLHGIRYEDVDLALRLQTDATGQLASNGTSPLAFDRNYSSSGRGVSFDVGAGAVIGPFEIGGSMNNLAHRMTWRGVASRRYAMASLFSGDARFITSAPQPFGTVRSELPSDYRANLSFNGRTLAFRTEVSREWEKVAFRGGVEHTSDRLQFRVATTYVDEAWFPTAGLSVGLTKRLWVDVAGFTTNSNVERERRFAVASSIRIASR